MNTQLYVAHYRVKNPVKSASENRRWVATHYYRSLDKSREATRQTSFKHYHGSLTKSREATIKRVARYYCQNLSQSRALSRTSTARQYMKDLLESRSKSSSMAYRKKAEAVRRGNRDRYSLAAKVEVTCLMKHFQDTFSANKKIVLKLMKALKKVQTDLQPKCRPSTQYAACKLASSHLVRFALQIRRKAVGSLLGIKKISWSFSFTTSLTLASVRILSPGSLTLRTQHMSKLMFLHPL